MLRKLYKYLTFKTVTGNNYIIRVFYGLYFAIISIYTTNIPTANAQFILQGVEAIYAATQWKALDPPLLDCLTRTVKPHPNELIRRGIVPSSSLLKNHVTKCYGVAGPPTLGVTLSRVAYKKASAMEIYIRDMSGDNDFSEVLGIDEKIAQVQTVLPASVAEESGIIPGDVIYKINNQVIFDGKLESILLTITPNVKISVVIWRDNDLRSIPVKFKTMEERKKFKNELFKKEEEEKQEIKRAVLEAKRKEYEEVKRKEYEEVKRKKKEKEEQERKKKQESEKKLKLEYARKEAKKKQKLLQLKRREQLFKLATKKDANQILNDIQNFAKETPGQLDILKLAEFFSPAKEEVKNNQFTKNSSSLKKLISFASKNELFVIYREKLLIARLKGLNEKKAVQIKKIKSGVTLLKRKIKEDPFGPMASELIKTVKEYANVSEKETLNALQLSVNKLAIIMLNQGIKPQFQYGKINNNTSKLKNKNINSDQNYSKLNPSNNLDKTYTSILDRP